MVRVNTRRGMPINPSRNCGRNVTLKPMKTSQNCALPRRSSSMRPKSFGHQYARPPKIANIAPPSSM